jgi:hypothetical protein
MATLRTSQLSSTVLRSGTATINTSAALSAVERATQTSAQQIQASSARDDQTRVTSSLTTTQVISSVATTARARSSTTTTVSVSSSKSADLQSSAEANKILKDITVATVAVASKTQASIATQSSGGGGITISVPTVPSGGTEDGKFSITSRDKSTDVFGTSDGSSSDGFSLTSRDRATDVVGTSSKSTSMTRPVGSSDSDDLHSKSIDLTFRVIDVETSDSKSTLATRDTDKKTVNNDLKDALSTTNKTLGLLPSSSKGIGDKELKSIRERVAAKTNFKQTDNLVIRTRVQNKDFTPVARPTPVIDSVIKKDETAKTQTKTVTSTLLDRETKTDIRSEEKEVVSSFSDPVLFSGSFAIGSDSYNLDTPNKDLRSYSQELLSSFDQLGSTFPECEIIAMIKDERGKVIIVFRLSDFNNFLIKIFDTFYDRKVFYNGYSTIETANTFLVSDFVSSMPRTESPNDILSFTRNQAKEAVTRNKDTIKKYGINVDLNYSIFGTDEDCIKAKKLLEIGAFDYNYNPNIQDDTIFVHKIYGSDMVSATGPISTSSSTVAASSTSSGATITTSIGSVPTTSTGPISTSSGASGIGARVSSGGTLTTSTSSGTRFSPVGT